mmetsp:Transcript_56801/g.163022  ORF Transcript_56801/g.163022 Transcript_56801/m.163022 type:complete len:313 (+) Transcript_56801:2861-3799(+)
MMRVAGLQDDAPEQALGALAALGQRLQRRRDAAKRSATYRRHGVGAASHQGHEQAAHEFGAGAVGAALRQAAAALQAQHCDLRAEDAGANALALEDPRKEGHEALHTGRCERCGRVEAGADQHPAILGQRQRHTLRLLLRGGVGGVLRLGDQAARDQGAAPRRDCGLVLHVRHLAQQRDDAVRRVGPPLRAVGCQHADQLQKGYDGVVVGLPAGPPPSDLFLALGSGPICGPICGHHLCNLVSSLGDFLVAFVVLLALTLLLAAALLGGLIGVLTPRRVVVLAFGPRRGVKQLRVVPHEPASEVQRGGPGLL